MTTSDATPRDKTTAEKLRELLAADPNWNLAAETATDTDTVEEPTDNWPKPLIAKIAFPGILGDFVRAACANSEADPAAVAITFLIRFGIECGANKYIQVGEDKHYPRTNGCLVGDSSKARKGVSAGATKTLFSLLPGQCRTSDGPLSSGEGIVFAVRDAVREWKIEKKTNIGEWITTDPGVDDKRLFIQESEFVNALTSTKMDGNRLSSVIRQAFDNTNIEPLTKGNRISATNPHVGFVGHITYPELKDQLSRREMFNGFGNRILWICSRRQRLVPRPLRIEDEVMRGIRDVIGQRLVDAQYPGVFEYSDPAEELWLNEYLKLSAAYSGAAGCLVNRGEAHVTRLSLIYALLAGHNRIELDDVQAALEVWRYCMESVFFLFGQTSSDKRRNRIIDALSKETDNALTKDAVRTKCFSGHIKSEELDVLLEKMQADGLVKITTEQTAGAPKKIISLMRFKRDKRDKPPTPPPYGAYGAYRAKEKEKTVFGDAETFDLTDEDLL